MLTNNIVSFEQLGPESYKSCSPCKTMEEHGDVHIHLKVNYLIWLPALTIYSVTMIFLTQQDSTLIREAGDQLIVHEHLASHSAAIDR